MKNRKRYTSLFAYGTSLLLPYVYMMAPTAIAEPLVSSATTFNIVGQPLPSALAQYSEQSGVQVTSASALVEQKPSKGVSGRVDARTALRKLLEGTDLEFEFVDDGTVVIVPARAKAAPLPREKTATGAKRGEGVSEEHEVIVTGSHIRSTLASPSPVFSFDRLDFAVSGATSIQAFMRTIPQNFNGGRTEASAAVADYRHGGRDNLTQGSGINIRGLGNESTLVLLNGRRMAPGSFGSFYDVSTIPLSAVERIDILADGSSAIYGSDAIGGVVNIILRDTFDGSQSSIGFGGVTEGDLHDLRANQLLGTTWQTGSVMLNLDYAHRDRLRAGDRNFARGLWNGRNDLLPEEQRLSGLLSWNQDITSSLRFSVDGYASDRDAQSDHSYHRIPNDQQATEAETEFFGGTAELIWTSANDWELTLAHTYSCTDNDRYNDLGTHAPGYTRVRSDLGVSATEIKAYGSAFATAGGISRLAIGAERRREWMEVRRTNLPNVAQRVSLDRKVDAAYVELQVPLIRTDHTLRATLLELTGALRYEDYSDEGRTDNIKLSATWSPFRHVDLHATWGTSFRAPYLYQYDPTFGMGVLLDAPNPASPNGSTLIAMAGLAPHPDLGPETATTWTAGFSIAPGPMGALQVSGTYFHIDYDNRITDQLLGSSPFSDPVLSQQIVMPPDPALLQWIRSAPAYYNLSAHELDQAEATLDIRTNNQSAATISGVDLMVASDLATSFGMITAGVNANYLFAFDTWVNHSSPRRRILNTVSNPPDFRARGQLAWENMPWSASASINYIDDYVDNQLLESKKVSSWTTFDLSAAYAFPKTTGWQRGLTFRANVLNVVNKAPPHIQDRGGAYGDPGYDTQNASPLGRFISFEISKAW